MYDFEKFLDLFQQFAPSHKFTDEETAFLKEEYADLKAFVRGLEKKDTSRKKIDFIDVLPDEIFYHRDACYVKISEDEAREFQGRLLRKFGKLTEVEINHNL